MLDLVIFITYLQPELEAKTVVTSGKGRGGGILLLSATDSDHKL